MLFASTKRFFLFITFCYSPQGTMKNYGLLQHRSSLLIEQGKPSLGRQGKYICRLKNEAENVFVELKANCELLCDVCIYIFPYFLLRYKSLRVLKVCQRKPDFPCLSCDVVCAGEKWILEHLKTSEKSFQQLTSRDKYIELNSSPHSLLSLPKSSQAQHLKHPFDYPFFMPNGFSIRASIDHISFRFQSKTNPKKCFEPVLETKAGHENSR